MALDGRGLLLLGPSGVGKSRLAAQLVALGAVLVADDRVCLSGADLRAAPPPRLAGLIELRGIGLLRLPFRAGVPLALAAQLHPGRAGPMERLPPPQVWQHLDKALPLIHLAGDDPAAPALALLALRHGPALTEFPAP